VRHAVPRLPLGATTGLWALPDETERLRVVESWTKLPEFTSVNWHEAGAAQLADLLLSKGVGIEAGIFHAGAAESWAASEFARHCMRVMIELPPDADIATADDLLSQVMAVGSPAQVLLHGVDPKFPCCVDELGC
jgi:uncharacterized protein (DUF849 family)